MEVWRAIAVGVTRFDRNTFDALSAVLRLSPAFGYRPTERTNLPPLPDALLAPLMDRFGVVRLMDGSANIGAFEIVP